MSHVCATLLTSVMRQPISSRNQGWEAQFKKDIFFYLFLKKTSAAEISFYLFYICRIGHVTFFSSQRQLATKNAQKRSFRCLLIE
jgi:hypothetical protein